LTSSDQTYELFFIPVALKEWKQLDNSVRMRLKKKLENVLQSPFMEHNRLSGELTQCFKIKDLKSGYRLVYGVQEKKVVVFAVGKREKLKVYLAALKRIEI
jgi:mRNA interferase RelE/StbE